MNEVTIVGLGAMGARLAELLLSQRRRVAVWNRTESKAMQLASRGAWRAPSAAEAFSASPVVIMCVYDRQAVKEILDMPGVAGAVAGKVIIQLTTGGPQEARAALAWAQEHHAHYLEGAIQAAPSQMGQADTPVLVSGDSSTFSDVQPILRQLAGNWVYLGEAIEGAATMDLATLSYVYGSFMGFLHGARIAQTKGLDVAQLGRVVQDISPSFGAFFAHEGNVIQSGNFAITESPLRISVSATRRIHDFSVAAGINTELSALAASWLARADAAGLANEELAAVIKVLGPH
ncbi:MAG: 3-hydroxyisobutyrate dehydrogenase [Ramlibacter sp.]|jgi:3-hydroxyisobutyrate dehydrogenase-like beta-hydroxyacid dehydrogenase|nr:3-hydroxyisobutyrate dehydrogenase [Ramlibacter sp.]